MKDDFPIFKNNKDLVYLDNAATTQKPFCVIEKEAEIYSRINSNVHRSCHKLSNLCTKELEKSREIVRDFINAQYSEEIIFTSGVTASLNIIALGFVEKYLKKNNEILITAFEHHSNFIPFQQVALKKGAKLSFIKTNKYGEICIEDLTKKLSKNTPFVVISHVSNVTGVLNDLKLIADIVHKNNSILIVDGAQGIAHLGMNVKYVDFYSFSAHKMYGPNGVGILYGKKEYLEEMNPVFFGGEMVEDVRKSFTTFAKLPLKLEAGTPNYVGNIAFATSIIYIKQHQEDFLKEKSLTNYLIMELNKRNNIEVYSDINNCHGVVSFNVKHIHPLDIALFLDSQNIAVRCGNHCAQLAMNELNVSGTVRVSLGIYNKKDDIAKFLEALDKSLKILRASND